MEIRYGAEPSICVSMQVRVAVKVSDAAVKRKVEHENIKDNKNREYSKSRIQ